MAIAQVVTGQGALANVFELGAGPAVLLVTAIMKMPVAAQLGTTGTLSHLGLDVGPGDATVLLHVIESDLIRDALITQRRGQPAEHRAGFAAPDCGSDLIGSELRPDVIDQARRAGQTADCMDHAYGVIDRQRCGSMKFGRFLLLDVTAASSRPGNHRT